MTCSRRSALAAIAGLSALAAIAPATGLRAAMLPAVKPQRLRKGDTLGIVAPAGFVGDRFGIEEVGDAVRAMGLEPRFADNLTARAGYLAGTDAERATAFTAMMTDPTVRAVMAVRGGWGCARMLPLVDWKAVARAPKLFAGFSDNTALHMALAARTGMVSLHSPNASASWGAPEWESFRAIAFDGATPTYRVNDARAGGLGRFAGRVRTFAPGTARGRLLGGNLSVLAALVGTPWLPDFSGAILFLEDTNESEYRIDRMMTQLALSGIFGKVAGVVFGQCSSCVNPDPSWGNYTVYEVMAQHLSDLGVPAFQGAQVGHVSGQWTMPEGVLAEIDAGAGSIRLLESAVV